MNYIKKERESFVKKNPKLKVTEVTKKMAEEWRNKSDAEKKKYA
jgi:hypothetical protein